MVLHVRMHVRVAKMFFTGSGSRGGALEAAAAMQPACQLVGTRRTRISNACELKVEPEGAAIMLHAVAMLSR